jgi:hypothetical protein
MRSPLSALANEFGSRGFVRTHRSWLFNARQITALEPEGSGDPQLPIFVAKILISARAVTNGFCVSRKSGGAACPCSIFFDLPRRGQARLAIPQHSAIVAKARKGTSGMPVVGFISEKGGVAKTTACYHIAIAFAPRFGVGSGMAGSR